MYIQRIFDILPYALERYNLDVALAGRKGGKWITWSMSQYCEMVELTSYGLLQLDVNPGDRIATISTNRPEWNFVDMGMLQIGAVHVPLYPTINDEELLWALTESEASVIFAGNKFLVQKITSLMPKLPFVRHLFSFDEVQGVQPFSNLIEIGRNNYRPDLLNKRKVMVKASDLASIIYTSGTTSEPKGVMLSHANHVSNVLVASFTIRLRPNETILSYLPLSHSYERMVNYVCQYIGLKIYYTDSVNNILANFREVKPQILVTVPLLLERVYEGILKKGMKLSGLARMIFNWSLSLGSRYRHGEKRSLWYNIQLRIAHRLVFHKWQEALGGRMKKIICGGSKVQPHLLQVFWAAGIPVFEGYGLTEASPLVAYNTEDDFKPGTIGKPITDLLVRISSEGELLVKGAGIMMGYYRQPELTSQVIDNDGWLHTGDKAEMDSEGFLRITGRIKEIFKTASGVYVYPETLENKLKQSFFIANCMVVGEHRNYLAAIITVNFEYLREWCSEHHIESSPDNSVLLLHSKVKAQLDAEVMKYGQSPKESENIARWYFTPDEWSIDTGELSPSLKLRRRFVIEKYKESIMGMY